MDNNLKDKNKQPLAGAGQVFAKAEQAWWQPALVIGTEIISWIVGPLLIALFLGKWLDNKYESAPKFLLILVGIAFVASNIGIVLNTIKYSKTLDKEDNKKNGIKSNRTNSN